MIVMVTAQIHKGGELGKLVSLWALWEPQSAVRIYSLVSAHSRSGLSFLPQYRYASFGPWRGLWCQCLSSGLFPHRYSFAGSTVRGSGLVGVSDDRICWIALEGRAVAGDRIQDEQAIQSHR